jgi:hypothetical protein
MQFTDEKEVRTTEHTNRRSALDEWNKVLIFFCIFNKSIKLGCT